jgi:hypothetical protein
MLKKVLILACLSLAGNLDVSSCFVDLLQTSAKWCQALSSVYHAHVHLIIGQIPAAPLYPCTPVQMQKAAVACRLMGRAALRHHVLAKRGRLVAIQDDKCQDSTEATFAYIKHQYETVTGELLAPA